MSTEVEYEKREIYSQMFRATFYTLLFLVMVMMCGCGGGGGGGAAGDATKTSAAKVLASIVIQPADNKLAVGKTQQFTAFGKYSDGTMSPDMSSSVNWLSSSPAVASITSNGMVSAVAAGQTTITASYGGVSGTTTLSVPATRLVLIAITPSNQRIAVNTAQQFTATGAYSNGTFQDLTSAVSWISSNPAVATITPAGKASAVAGGSTTITAVFGPVLGSISASSNLTVTTATLNSIAITPLNSTVAVGTTQQFSATGTFSDSTTQDLTSLVTWSSSPNSIATIAQSGKANAVNSGSATITAALNGVSATATMNVKAATLLSIAVSPSNPVLAAGTTQQFIATGTFLDNSTSTNFPQDLTSSVTWNSSDSTFAAIGQDGKATAITAGSTVITAAFAGKSGSQNLNVTPADVTGTWDGTYTIYDAVDKNEIGTYKFRLVISQSGTSVTGTSSLRYDIVSQRADGQFVEGIVTGSQIDLKFIYIDPRSSHQMVNIGSATLSDTSMNGNVLENYNGGYNCSYIFSLKKL